MNYPARLGAGRRIAKRLYRATTLALAALVTAMLAWDVATGVPPRDPAIAAARRAATSRVAYDREALSEPTVEPVVEPVAESAEESTTTPVAVPSSDARPSPAPPAEPAPAPATSPKPPLLTGPAEPAEADAAPGIAAAGAADPAPVAEPAEAVRMTTTTQPAAPARTPAAASSLTGHDRHLASRPFGTHQAYDFRIGALVGPGDDSGVRSALGALAAMLRDRKLAAPPLSADGLTVAKLLYEKDLSVAPTVRDVRVARPVLQAGGTMSAELRVLAGDGAGLGVAILAKTADGTWVVEHLDLDAKALALPRKDDGDWDPYTDLPRD